MTVLEQISNPYLASLVLGLLYGLTFCTSACLPYVVSYIAGIGAGFKKGFKIALYYNTGRIAAYTIIGIIVGLSTAVISEEFFQSYQEYSSFAFGAVIIAIGATILLKKPAACTCPPPENEAKSMPFIGKLTNRFDIRAFFMGLTRGLIICPPLIAVILYAATFSPADCVIMAVLFGVGTTLSPLLILSGATGWLLNKAPLFKTWVSKIGGAFLIIMGTITLFTATLTFI